MGPARATRLAPDVVRHLLHAHDRSEERDEERRRGRDALASQLDDVAQLVHEQEQHEADREAPPQIQAYAAIETSIVADVAKILSLKIASATALNLKIR